MASLAHAPLRGAFRVPAVRASSCRQTKGSMCAARSMFAAQSMCLRLDMRRRAAHEKAE